MSFVVTSLIACADPKKDVEDETEIVDTGNIQDGTEVEKTIEIDTPVISNE